MLRGLIRSGEEHHDGPFFGVRGLFHEVRPLDDEAERIGKRQGARTVERAELAEGMAEKEIRRKTLLLQKLKDRGRGDED